MRRIVALVVLVLVGAGVAVLLRNTPHQSVESASVRVSAALDELRSPDQVTTPVVTERTRTYEEAVTALAESVIAIRDGTSRTSASVETMARLAGDQQILRALRHLPPEEPMEAIDAARYANIGAQERIVRGLEGVSPASRGGVNESLSCPDCNVVFIVLTTLRKDRIGLYGYAKGTTPNMDAFFSSALRFDDVLSPSSWTIPDAVTLFTSLFPYGHGIAYRESPSTPVVYNERITTLAQELSREGYATAGFTGGGDYNRGWNGLDRGFDLYLDEVTFSDFGIAGDTTLGGVKLQYAPLRDFVGLATDWLDKHGEEKFFLFVQGYDTHCPLEPREPYASRFTAGLSSEVDFSVCHWRFGDISAGEKEAGEWNTVVVRKSNESNVAVSEGVTLSSGDVAYMQGLYDARVAEVDDRLAVLFDTLERPEFASNTIIVLMSEHGDTLGEHGSFMRGAAIRGATLEGALSVPLLIKHPKVKDPIVVTDLVQLVDIMPTILAILDVEDSQAVLREGTALRLSAFGEAPSNEYAYAGAQYLPLVRNPYYSRASMSEVIRRGDWKLVREIIFGKDGYAKDTVSYKLYDLSNDPDENTDLSAQQSRIVEELAEKLEQWSGRYFPSL